MAAAAPADPRVQLQMLMIRNGINIPTSQVILNQGMTDIATISTFSDDTIKDTLKTVNRYIAPQIGIVMGQLVSIPQPAFAAFLEFKYWYWMRVKTGEDSSADALTTVEQVRIRQRMQFVKERKTEMEKITLDKPPQLKSFKDWYTWYELFDNYMKQSYGASDIGIDYVYREVEVPTAEIRQAVYTSEDQRLYNLLLLNNNGFKLDSQRVWIELKSLICDGPGWSFIKRFETRQDGRGAMRALIRQNEGENSTLIRKQKAYSALNALSFEGTRKQWTFANFITAHQKQHNILEDCGEPVPETKKVTDFLAQIRDPTLEASIKVVLGDRTKLNSFELCQQYLSTCQASATVHNRNKRGRQVAGIATEGGGSKKKPKLEAKNYPKHIWYKVFDKEDRMKVDKMRKEKRAAAETKKSRVKSVTFSPDTEGGENDLLIAAAKAILKSEAKGKGKDDSKKNTKGGKAGNQFGRAGHKVKQDDGDSD